MKIFWKQLNQLVNLEQISLHEAAIKLTLAGFEVDNIQYIEEVKDTLLEISITANRQDITGWIQIAIEIAAIMKQPLRLNQKLDNIQVLELDNIQGLSSPCEIYTCYIQPISIFNQNQCTTQHIKVLGLNATSSILDTVQFMNLKWGEDIRVYEIAQYQYQAKNLIIKQDEEQNSKKNKLNVYIDNKKLLEIDANNIHNKDSNICLLLLNYRQKKRNNHQHCLHAYSEILKSIKVSAYTNNKALIHYYSYKETSAHKITLTSNQINRILGPINDRSSLKKLDLNTIAKITASLNMTTEITQEQLIVTIPSSRENDIKNETDIAEEVARIYGFDKFYDRLPKFPHGSQKLLRCTAKQKVRRSLRSIGLHEIINQSFTAKEIREHNARIINPISQEQTRLRANLVNGMVNTKKHNINQGNCNFEAFEIGKVFAINKSKHAYEESERLSVMLGNSKFNQSTWQTDATPLSWLQAKGQAEEIFERIDANVSWSNISSSSQLIESVKHHTHPQNSLYLMHENKIIGIMSQAHDLSSSIKTKSYFIEINLDKLIQAIKSKNHLQHTYQHYSAYPKVSRDFSVTISTKISMKKIRESINNLRNRKEKIIESVDVISEYYHGKNKKTICFRAIYRSKNKTLTSQEVKILDNILKSELSIFQSKT